ncbi:hypothetical protein IAT40_003829 [Kwoniella sp. CBS 6097]
MEGIGANQPGGGGGGGGGTLVSTRNGKRKTGWGNLPVHILHNILSFAQENVTLDDCLQNRWGHDDKTAEIALAISQRIWLCDMRGVCSGWKRAVDSHAFWPAYTLLLDPSRPHSSTIDDFHSSRLTPSTPSFPTLFHRSRHTTLRICLACRLNHPTRLGFYPAVPKRLTWTNRYGKSPTCDKHASHFCSDCMKEFGTETSSPTYGRGGRRTISPEIPAATGLLPTQHADTDDRGVVRQRGSLICTSCRTAAITLKLKRMLIGCSRGTLPVKGLSNNWFAKFPVKNYIEFGTGTAHTEARLAIEVQWLEDHTRWKELRPTAEALQDYESQLKYVFYNRETNGDIEDPRAKQIRLGQEAELRGDDWNGIESARDKAERYWLYKKWWRAREEDAESDDSDDDVEDYGGLNRRYYDKLREGCMNDFINDRIRFGFWVSPSDEVSQHVLNAQAPSMSRTHTPMVQLALGAKHPFMGITDLSFTPIDAANESAGLIDLQIDRTAGKVDPFLPPRHLLEELEELFQERLAQKIEPAMRELVLRIRSYFDGDDEEAERYCKGLSVADLMEKLSEWKFWVPRQLADAVVAQADQASTDTSANPKVNPTDRARSVQPNSSGKASSDVKSESKIHTSPRIEMVEEVIEPSVVDYGIKEVDSTPHTIASDPTSISSDSTIQGDQSPAIQGTHRDTSAVTSIDVDEQSRKSSLGKRKSPSEEKRVDDSSTESQNFDGVGRDEKRFKSSSPSARLTPAQVIPSTPHPHVVGHRNGPSGDDECNNASGETGPVKRKVPPSPEPHHINRSQRTVSPPAPPHFDLPLERLRRDTLSVLEGSSAPLTPTPFGGPIQQTLGMHEHILRDEEEEESRSDGASLDEDEDQEMMGDEYVFDDISVERSSDADVGEEEDESLIGNEEEQPERELFLQTKTRTINKHGSRDSSEITSGTMPLTPGSDFDLNDDDACSNQQFGGVMFGTEFEAYRWKSPALQQRQQRQQHQQHQQHQQQQRNRQHTGARMFKPIDSLKRYASDNNAKVPFIPLPLTQTISALNSAAAAAAVNASASATVSAGWSLGPEAERILLENWYESQSILRECRCRICERARKKEMEIWTSVGVRIRGWN